MLEHCNYPDVPCFATDLKNVDTYVTVARFVPVLFLSLLVVQASRLYLIFDN